jgi:hypothetical protein
MPDEGGRKQFSQASPDDGESVALSRMSVAVSYDAALFDAESGAPLAAGPGAQLQGQFDVIVERPKMAWLRSVQTALAYDDGAKTTVTLNDAEGFYPDDVVATWFFTTEGDPTSHALSSGAVRVIGKAKQLVFEFPSLKRMGIKPKPGSVPEHFKKKRNVNPKPPAEMTERTAADPTPERSFMVKIRRGPATAHDEADYLFYPWKYAVADAKPELKAGMRMATSRSVLPHANHSAPLDVHIVLPDTEVEGGRAPVTGFKLMVQGADAAIASTTPAGSAAPPADGARTHFELMKSGTLTLSLNGLYKDAKVVLKVVAPAGWAAPDDIELKVID